MSQETVKPYVCEVESYSVGNVMATLRLMSDDKSFINFFYIDDVKPIDVEDETTRENLKSIVDELKTLNENVLIDVEFIYQKY